MNLLKSPEYKEVTAQTLDELWFIAEKLGRVEVDHSFGDESIYEVEIMFKRKTGTRVYAIGKDESIHTAMEKAIIEATKIGGGNV